MQNGICRRRYLSGKSQEDHARVERRVRQRRIRKRRIHPLPGSRPSVHHPAEAGQHTDQQQENPELRNHAPRQGDGQERENIRIHRQRTIDPGTNRQRGHLDERAPSDLRHVARGAQRRTDPVFEQGIHFAENPFGRRAQTAQAHRIGSAAEQLRRDHPHRGDGTAGRRDQARHPVADRTLEKSHIGRPQQYGSRPDPQRREPNDHHHTRSAERFVQQHLHRRPDRLRRSARIHSHDRSGKGKNRQAL